MTDDLWCSHSSALVKAEIGCNGEDNEWRKCRKGGKKKVVCLVVVTTVTVAKRHLSCRML